MNKPLSSQKIAILVANGFNEQDLTHTQRALQASGAKASVIGMDSGLVNSWTGQAWGHNFMTDAQLNSALAADFTMLVVPGGRRSVDKLKLTAHTKRFIGGFMDAGKPVAMMDDAVELLAFANKVEGRTVVAAADSLQIVKEAGGNISDGEIAFDGNLMSGYTSSIEETVNAVLEHFINESSMKAAA